MEITKEDHIDCLEQAKVEEPIHEIEEEYNEYLEEKIKDIKTI